MYWESVDFLEMSFHFYCFIRAALNYSEVIYNTWEISSWEICMASFYFIFITWCFAYMINQIQKFSSTINQMFGLYRHMRPCLVRYSFCSFIGMYRESVSSLSWPSPLSISDYQIKCIYHIVLIAAFYIANKFYNWACVVFINE